MNVYEVRVDGVTKKVTADYYTIGDDGKSYVRFYRVITDPNSEDKAKLVAEFSCGYVYITLESDNLVLLDYPPIRRSAWHPGCYDPDEPTAFTK